MAEASTAQSSREVGQESFNPGWRLCAALGSLAVVNLAAALDATSLSVALPAITSDLHGTAVEAFWSGTSFLLTSTVIQPNFVTFSHAFGRRPVLLLALFLFTLGALLCGISTTFTLMLCGRSIQGIGCGGIIVLTQILVTDLVPLRERGKYVSIISIVWAVGSVTGPIIGGVFAQNDAWRWIFWINFPICAIGFVGVISFLNLESRKNSLRERLMEVDYFGSIMGVSSLTIFLIPITWGGVMYAWTSWQTLVPLILGAVGLFAFCLYESRFAKYTLLPMRLFRNHCTSICYLATFTHGVVLWSLLYYLPLYFEGVKGYNPVISGLAALPQTCTVIPCAVAVGFVAAKTGRYRWALWAGWMLTTFGCGILYLLNEDSSATQCVFLQLISGIGMGLLFPSMALSIQASAPKEDVTAAATFFCFFRGLGQTMGIAVSGVIFQNRVNLEFERYPDLAAAATQYSLDAVALVQTISHLPFDSSQTQHLKTGLADALKAIWIVMCGLSGIALFTSLFVERYTLDRELSTEQGFRDGPSMGKGQCLVDVEAFKERGNDLDISSIGLKEPKEAVEQIMNSSKSLRSGPSPVCRTVSSSMTAMLDNAPCSHE